MGEAFASSPEFLWKRPVTVIACCTSGSAYMTSASVSFSDASLVKPYLRVLLFPVAIAVGCGLLFRHPPGRTQGPRQPYLLHKDTQCNLCRLTYPLVPLRTCKSGSHFISALLARNLALARRLDNVSRASRSTHNKIKPTVGFWYSRRRRQSCCVDSASLYCLQSPLAWQSGSPE